MSRLRREGAWFPNTRINYLPTLTSVGHATIGTGTDPRIHGLAANTLFSRVTQKPQPAYNALDPNELMALTLADVWNLTTDGRGHHRRAGRRHPRHGGTGRTRRVPGERPARDRLQLQHAGCRLGDQSAVL